ncbi:MAG: hypothetical protein M0C28_14130 [Candidatus Moduliflexus flocculans]|nr:hypothetical protein [Candidatus Moduliflexus flocculans]
MMAFDEQDIPPAVAARGLKNYWGYSTHGFRAPHPRYCVDRRAGARASSGSMVRCAARGRHRGDPRRGLQSHRRGRRPTGRRISFRGLANDVFYHLDPRDRRRYLDFTGCGNTRQLQPSAGDAPASSTACDYWVERDARRRLPLRPRQRSSARGEDGVPLANPAAALGHRDRPRMLAGTEADRRGLGRGRAVPGRRLPGGCAGRSGTAATATTCAASCAASRARRRGCATRLAGSPDLYARRRPRCRRNSDQLHHLPRRLHALTTW